MGLDIHYRLTTPLTEPKDVRRVVETLRQFALDLPFEEVGELNEWTATEDDMDDQDAANDAERWLKASADAFVVEGHDVHWVPPCHAIAFLAWPGEGCGAANFGFGLYPSFIYLDSPSGRRERVATNLSGWQWKSFCTTGYASNPKHGGIDHFLRCHRYVVKLLDRIKQSGLATLEVRDEGKYWEQRDPKVLAQTVNDMNERSAGFYSIMREASGKKFKGPITDFQNFEHLEAKGLEQLADLRRALLRIDTEE